MLARPQSLHAVMSNAILRAVDTGTPSLRDIFSRQAMDRFEAGSTLFWEGVPLPEQCRPSLETIHRLPGEDIPQTRGPGINGT